MRKLCIVLLVNCLFLYATFALAKQDPELKQCKHQCRHQKQFGERQKEQCKRECEEYVREKEERRRETERERSLNPRRDKEREYRQCRETCQQHEEGRREQQECVGRCEEKRKEQMGEKEEFVMRREREDIGHREWKGEEDEEKVELNPYVFEDQHFTTHFGTEHGRVRVLQRFTERSKLFKGIDNFRVVIAEANPQTFIVPNHWDADSIFFAAKGRGTVTLVLPDGKKSFNVERGHVMMAPAGVTVYLVNRDSNEKLILAHLVQTVSNPGKFQAFFGAGGRNPESFLNAVSTEILEAAFKMSRDNLQRIFSEQREGAIFKASKEQIRSMSQDDEGGIWPFMGGSSAGGGSRRSHRPINLFRQRPTKSNEFGELFEIDSRDFKQLQDTEIAVSFANFTQGTMHAPYYNSRATKIAIVVDGRGYFEMACPHVSTKQDRQQNHHEREIQRGRSRRGRGAEESPIHYVKISGELRRGTVFIIPAGHPFVTIASRDQNLQVMCFEINVENNSKVTLAGRNSILKNFEREAKELAFGASADEVDRVLGNQDKDFFFSGPRGQREERAYV